METTWTLDPAPLALAALAALLYAQAFARLRRRAPAHATWRHAFFFALGLAVSLLALVSPVDAVGEDQLLSAHMLQHLLLGDLGPLLLVLGTRGPLALFLLPAPALRVVARSPLRRLARPRVALVAWLAAIGDWHVPAAYDAAIAHPALHVTEHACFALAGVLAWTQILRGPLTVGRRALFALVLLVSSSVLAEVLVASPPLYPYYAAMRSRPFGWSAGQDQSHAALLMMAEQFATLATAILFLVRAHVERVAPELTPHEVA